MGRLQTTKQVLRFIKRIGSDSCSQAIALAQITGRINRRRNKRPATNICFCFSSIHVILNISAAFANSDNTIVFCSPYTVAPITTIANRLGFRAAGGRGPVDLHLSALKQLLAAWSRGDQIKIWIPHLSTYEYTGQLRAFIHELAGFGAVAYIDDGLGFLSRESDMFAKQFVPRDALLHTWDFTDPPNTPEASRTLGRSSFQRALEIIQTRSPSLICEGTEQLERHASAAGLNTVPQEMPVDIIVASKLLDPGHCLRFLATSADPRPGFYVPHYNTAKNSTRLSNAYPALHMDSPEFGLLGIARAHRCRILFGITSTISSLIELLLRDESAHPVALVFIAKQPRRDSQIAELKNFSRMLEHYQQLPIFSQRGLTLTSAFEESVLEHSRITLNGARAAGEANHDDARA